MAQVTTTEELLVRVGEHDAEALGELYDRFAPALFGMMTHIVRDRHRAEEILQDVFLHLWSEARTLLEANGSVAAWLVMNARYLALDRLRAEKPVQQHNATRQARDLAAGGEIDGPSTRRIASAKSPQGLPVHRAPGSKSHVFKTPAPPVWPAAWIPSPQEVARVDERLSLLQKVMNQLPKPQSAALELSVFGGYREEEIALELDEPLGKVRTSLCAAVTFLRHRRRAVVGSWAANI